MAGDIGFAVRTPTLTLFPISRFRHTVAEITSLEREEKASLVQCRCSYAGEEYYDSIVTC
jgi:hypothetical protein